MELPEQLAAYKSQIIYLSSLYFVSVSVLYLWGYWGTFDINIIEFLSVTDVVKLAAYPVGSALILFAIGVVVGELHNSSGRALPEGGGREGLIGRFLNRHGTPVSALYLIVCVLVYLFMPEKWTLLPLLISWPVSVAMLRLEFVRTYLPDRFRASIVFLATMFPLIAYGTGVRDAEHILDGKKYKYVRVGSSVLKYVGHASDNLFFITSDNAAIVIKKLDQIAGEPMAFYPPIRGNCHTVSEWFGCVLNGKLPAEVAPPK